MVHRPHILRYKGKLKKIDQEKMQKVRDAQNTARQEVNKLKIGPTMTAIATFGAAIIFITPVIYYYYSKNQKQEEYFKMHKYQENDEDKEGELLLLESNQYEMRPDQVKDIAKTQNKGVMVVDISFYDNLKEIFHIFEEAKPIELGLTDGGALFELTKQFIEAIFHSFFCQNAYNQFKQGKLANKDIHELLREYNKGGHEYESGSIDIQNVKNAGKNSINAKKGSGSPPSFLNFKSQKLGTNREEQDIKSLYDVCFDIIIYLLISLSENEDGEVNYDVSSNLMQTFTRHLRMHFQQIASSSNRQYQYCLQSVLALSKILQNSKNMMSVAKERGIINNLFQIVPIMFREEAEQMNQHIIGQAGPDFNLNTLVIGQGFQGSQGYQQVQVQQVGQGGLQSGKSSIANMGGINMVSQSPINLNSKNEEEKKGSYLDKPIKKKLSFNRASSEPPSGNKNAVMPVREDMIDEEVDYDTKGGQDVESSRNIQRIIGVHEKNIPPLMMSQVQSMQSQIALQQQNSSNSVMNNYFNMPLGQFNTTINQNQQIGFKFNIIPQTTLAKSRLTRRQMSMSRKHTQKMSSVSNFAQLMYGEESGKHREQNNRFDMSSFDQNDINQQQKSASQQRKGPQIPKLNINSIVYDNINSVQRIDALGLQTTNHAAAAQLTHQNKSSNRSNQISAYSNNNFENQLNAVSNKMGGNFLSNYQTNANVIRQQANESDDHNISIYDEINGSFVDDLNDGNNGYIYDNAEEKLRQLAIQLGESCLTNDLAALISQKRDLELVKSARKTVTNLRLNRLGMQKNHTMNIKPIQRSISVSYTAENIFRNKGSQKDFSDVMHSLIKMDNQAVKMNLDSKRHQETATINKRTRLVVLNLIYMLLKKYDIDEARFLKHPINALNSYIQSKEFQTRKYQKQVLALENQQFYLDKDIQLNPDEKVKISTSGRIINIHLHERNIRTLQAEDNSHLQQITEVEVNQSDTEEIKESDRYQTQENQGEYSRLSNGQNKSDIYHRFQSFIRLEGNEKLSCFLEKKSIFEQDFYQEEKVIYSIYQKFTFVNEDILRKQVMNELANFAAKDKSFDSKMYNTLTSAKIHGNSSFAQGLFMVNNLMGSNNNLPPPISGTPIKSLNNMNNNLSFDENDEDFYFKRDRNGDGMYILQNPSQMWMHNGIAYELNSSNNSKSTASTTISKEKIRKKLDVLLYQVDRRMKYILQQYFDKTQTRFAEDMTKELNTLNSYLEQQASRIMLYQIIEVNLEALLMIKKCLIDCALKTSKLILISQLIQYEFRYFCNGLYFFAEYLRLVSRLLRMSQTPETMKLLNEVLIFDEQWQESIKTFSISLYLSDIVSTININDRSNTQNVSLIIDELRGINLINFDEPYFISLIMSAQNIELYQQTKDSIYHVLFCSLDIMRYFKSVLHFYHDAIQRYFQNSNHNQKNKYPASGGPDGDKMKSDMKPINLDKKVDYNSTQKGSITDQTGNTNNDVILQKYWKNVIRKILYQYMYLITPPNGLFSQYLQYNAINYVNQNSSNNYYSKLSLSPSKRNDTLNQEYSYRSGNPPLNFKLTKSIINFTKLMFNIPDKFTKYVFIEELMLFYIRTHYISFVRLYNKNFSKKDQILTQTKDISLTLCKKHLECLFGIAKNRNEDTRRKLYQFKVVQFLTQEIELEFDVQQRRKRFIQLSKEEEDKIKQDQAKDQVINLKQEEQKAQKQLQNPPIIEQAQNQTNKPQNKFGMLGLKKLNLTGVAGASLFSGAGDPNEAQAQDISIITIEQNNHATQIDKQFQQIKDGNPPLKQNLELNKQDQIESKVNNSKEDDKVQVIQQEIFPPPQKKGLPPGLKKLNITGLGLSDLVQDNNDVKPANIEKPANQVEEIKQEIIQEAPNQQLPKKLPFGMPALKIAGLGLSDLVPDKPEEKKQPEPEKIQKQETTLKQENQNEDKVVEEIKQIQPQNQIKKPMGLGFKIPALNVAGLGLSDLVKDDKQEETKVQINIEEIKKSPKIQEQQQLQQQQQPPKKLGIPKLKIDGLGLSDLVQDKEEQKHMPPSIQIKIQDEQMKTINPDQNNHQTIDYGTMGKEELFKKQDGNLFDKTAPLKLFDADEYNNMNSQKSVEQQKNRQGKRLSDPQLMMESQESAQFLNQVKLNHGGMIINIPEEKLDDKRKQLLNKNRVNLIPPRQRNSISQSIRSNNEYEDSNISFFDKRSPPKDQILSEQFNLLNQNTLNLQGMKVESVMDNLSQMHSPNLDRRMTVNVNQSGIKNQLANTPMDTINSMHNEKRTQSLNANQGQTPLNNSSRSSNGSFVGKNKVYVPFLKFPEDIHEDPSGKIKIYQKPDENRFRLMKSKDQNATPEIQRPQAQNSITLIEQTIPSQSSLTMSNQKQKGGFGKKGKLLNINSQNSCNEGSQASSGGNGDQKIMKFNFNIEDQKQLRPDIPRPEKKEDKLLESSVQNFQFSSINTQDFQVPTVIIKKPTIPSLVIPQKQNESETSKLQQQIEFQQELNKNQIGGDLTNLEKSLNQQNNPKFQLLLDKTPSEQQKSPQKQFNNVKATMTQTLFKEEKEIVNTEANFYLKERNARPIYQDEDLHVLMLSLMTCLLLKPERGILDDLYCSQYPIDNGKQNILFLLHHHMNNPQNQQIIPKILNKVYEINPPLAGQRLLKLLCTSLFDIGHYNYGKNWKKIGDGAYAKVYEAETNLSEPQSVAIKQCLLPSTIYDRCVLHDIFTEITCLEELRLEPCVTDLYDYGLDNQCYYIVQKKYTCSLREWRMQQSKSLSENLSVYLSIYKEFLKSLQIIHSHNVTHYDIKCDNVLIDFSSQNSNHLSKSVSMLEDDRLKLAIADFGECKIFSDDKDELCQRNRGTDYYKSPEMLQLTLNTRKDTDKYDRRKQVGTNRISDIWSAGCMFFELLTGEILFYNQDYFAFLNRVTRAQEALFTSDKLELINNNVYLIDFLKYMLVRDSRLRPSIDNVVKRFEHVHALLVSTTAQATTLNRFTLGLQPQNSHNAGRGQNTLDHLLDQAQLILIQNSQVYGGEIKEENIQQNQQNNDQENQNQNVSIIDEVQNKKPSKKGSSIDIMQILEDIYLISNKWIKNNQLKAIRMGVTHLVIEQKYSSQSLRDKFETLEVPEFCEDYLLLNNHDSSNNEINPFTLMTGLGVLDFLRKVALQRGKVAFIENSNLNGETLMRNGIRQRLIRECLLICLNHIFQTNAYETYNLIRSQNLFFKIQSQRLGTLSKWSQITSKINQYLMTFPRFQCICGSCLIILKRQFANYQSMQTSSCNCCQYYKSVENSQCPSPGCNEFIQYLRTFFKSIYGVGTGSQAIDSLHWGFLEEEDFILGPNYLGQQQHNTIQKRMIISNMSKTIDKNSSIVSIVEKKNSGNVVRGGAIKEPIDFNMISKSSATVKNYNAYSRWKLYKCKECHVWTHAVNELENRYAILLNNRIKDNFQGINLSGGQQKSSQINISSLNNKQSNSTGVRVPILKRIKLSLPF